MELIFEFLVELILEGTIEISKNKKVPKIIRYPLILFIIVVFISIVLFLFFTGILVYQKINKIGGILLIIMGVVFLLASIIKFKKTYFLKKKKN